MVPGTFKGTEEKAVRMTLARAVDRRSILHYNPYSSIYPEWREKKPSNFTWFILTIHIPFVYTMYTQDILKGVVIWQ